MSKTRDEAMAIEATKYTMRLRQDEPNEQGEYEEHLYTFPAYDTVVRLMELYKMVAKVVSRNAPLFRWKSGRVPLRLFGIHGCTEGHVAPTQLGKELLQYANENMEGNRLQFPKHEFHPIIELFGRYARQIDSYVGVPTEEGCAKLNECVEAMRAEARTAVFQNRRDRHLRASREATKGVLALIDALFRRRSRILVVRLELSYRKGTTSLVPRSINDLFYHVSERQARDHRDALIRFLKREYQVPLLTYAWKEEQLQFTSNCYQLLLFFDGSVAHDGFSVGQQIGEHWVDAITGSKGRFHNCNASKHWDQGVGIINDYDTVKIKALKERVVPYLTKVDYFVRLVSKGRIFGKGGLPKAEGNKRGRPRKRPFVL
ncbi:inovirus-type Gp2 protein [Rhodanobacter sp. AS-Z3]|uniref:YagK/YfjJ domain-containing protein n=1 Tax=Rhodanobacter sp. AS-Z3 TaxID=3031330 RepID=UPI00247A6442|nr:inovirus-type Gp2 protein [Rhodanobacter sp. AS-Z3]WEN15716.1 inovirus-type Gp2 protein [Rhodanobacter sp. AS-Z3]